MKNKKIIAILMTLILSLSFSGCSRDDNTTTESSTIMNEEETKTILEEKEESESTKQETETTKETEKSNSTETEEQVSNSKSVNTETKESKTSESSQTESMQQEETKQTETPKPVHEHSYDVENITSNPTCENPGVKVLVCSCGSSVNESIAAIGHSWVTQYEEIFHESKGEMRSVQIGVSDGYVECGYCGATFSTISALDDHCANSGVFEHATSSYWVHDGEPIYEDQWVVTQEAFTEQNPYQICQTCGVRQ